MSEAFHVEYAKLEEVAKIFQDQGNCVSEMGDHLDGGFQRLKQSWSGEAYEKFYEEYIATLQKVFSLSNTLLNIDAGISNLATDLEEAETQAKSSFPQPTLFAFKQG